MPLPFPATSFSSAPYFFDTAKSQLIFTAALLIACLTGKNATTFAATSGATPRIVAMIEMIDGGHVVGVTRMRWQSITKYGDATAPMTPWIARMKTKALASEIARSH